MAVFISYSRKDRKQVEKLATDVRDLGRGVWLDSQIHGGDQWWPTILSHIRDSDLFIIALSRHWAASGACQAEYDYARQVERTVVPVSVKAMAGRSIPGSVAALQIVSYRHQDKAAFVELKKALDEAPKPGPLPFPVPPDPLAPRAEASRRFLAAAVTAVAVIAAILVILKVASSAGGRGNSGEQGAGTAVGTPTTVSATDPRVSTVRVEGTSVWTDTGIDLTSDDQVTIQAAGRVFHDPSNSTGPDGDPNPVLAQYNVVSGNHGALLARVGGAPAEVVGRVGSVDVGGGGRLWLGVNDAGPDNNHGFYSATVTVAPTG